ncbi:MAG: translation elongation factor Ts [Firmicutes bacterium]|mgnify:CR=1 FL=1|nr:translation elongation factor Ts [Bacillota bacterium]
MAEVTAAMVKELRERTGAGILDCKKALEETKGDIDKAIAYLREKGLAAAAKKAGRIAAEGLVDAYIHLGGRVGVLIEVNCETDFVAKTDAFKDFVKDMAMQVAAAKPEYVSREDVPAHIIEQEKEIYRAAARNEGKPEQIIERIVTGRMEKYFQETCLLEQPFIKDTDKTVQQVLQELIAQLGENMAIRRFARFERGEGIEKSGDDDFATEVMAELNK